MKGAIFYSSKYGSTAQYANWIAQATGLPVFDVRDSMADPSQYDYLVLGSPVIYYKLHIHKWVKRNLAIVLAKPIIFFSVSGAPAGDKLAGWMTESLPAELISKMKFVALRGRQNPKELTMYDWLMLKIAGLKNPDPVAAKQEFEGFDFMDKSTIEPIVEMVHEFQAKEVLAV